MNVSEALLLSSGNGPAECRQAVSLFLDWLAERAQDSGVDLDVSARCFPWPDLCGCAFAGQRC